MAAVFSMQGVGMILSPIVVIFFIYFNIKLDKIWRYILLFGAIPSGLAMVLRWNMHETAAFKTAGRTSFQLVELDNNNETPRGSSELKNNNIDTPSNKSPPDGVNDVPRKIDDVPGGVDDVPGGVDDVPGGVVDVPGEVDDVPREVDEFPRRVDEFPGGVDEFDEEIDEMADIIQYSRSSNFFEHFFSSIKTINKYKYTLIGSSLSWFLLDITFYGLGSFKSSEYSKYATVTGTVTDTVTNETYFSLFIALIALPGYLFSVFFIDRIGSVRLQKLGFLMMSLCFTVQAIIWNFVPSNSNLFFFNQIFLAFSFFFSNFGPNSTTFIIPAIKFPILIRATCHGISAASGKLGGALGAYALPPVSENFGQKSICIISATVSIIGYFVTVLFIDNDVQEED
eukprot:GHVL01022725.1.p1 GENE.GHVL01022725.1~~GHVL01022725.1.p1  ORF type:complete len:397 (+),score=106.83 GHVL01022725.1:523-1713(+)